MSSNMYEDAYAVYFGANEYEQLKAEQSTLEGQSTWEIGVTDMTVSGMNDHMEMRERYTDPNNTISLEILTDTIENTQMILNYNGKEMALRDCAMPSLFTTVGNPGSGYGRCDLINRVKCLNALLTGARKNSKILLRAGKASAVLSAQYEVMPISDLLAACDTIQNSFGAAEFLGGCVSHGYTVAKFRYPKASKRITEAYNKVLSVFNRKSQTITPVIVFQSSDTTAGSASLTPYLQLSNGITIPLGKGVRVDHKMRNEGTGLEKFTDESKLLFNKLETDISVMLPKMLSTEIEYPRNTFIGLCKYAGIKQKYGGIIEELVASDWPDHSGCTFLDIYEALTKVTTLALRDNVGEFSQRMLEIEEGICKVFRHQHYWTKFDLPGTVSWSYTPIGD